MFDREDLQVRKTSDQQNLPNIFNPTQDVDSDERHREVGLQQLPQQP